MDTVENLLAHYSAVRARLRGPVATPTVAIPKREPPPPAAEPPRVTPLKDERIAGVPVLPFNRVAAEEAAIAKARRRLEGAPLSNRQKLMVLPVLEDHDVMWADVVRVSRLAKLVNARRDVYRELFEMGMSFSQIGRVCQRDHTTIMYHLEKLPLERARG